MNSPKSPDYFMIKTGNIGTPDTRNFLFDNLLGLDNDPEWAVVAFGDILGEFDEVTSMDITKFSHIGEVNPVPEPSTILLLGTGLVGLVCYRRKRNKG
jgi:hypothetical protein